MAIEKDVSTAKPVELTDESLDDVSGAGIVIEERGTTNLNAASHSSVGTTSATQQLSNVASPLPPNIHSATVF